MKIMGIKGRAAVLRPVSTTIGLDGEEVVPPEDVLERMEKEQKAEAQNAPIQQKVEEGIQAGVKAGVSRISTELTAGVLAERAHLPEGNPTHIGTLPQKGPSTNNPEMDLGPGGDMARNARVAQGTQQGPLAGGGMGPQTHLTGNQPGPGAKPISGGVG
jgi:hypothetical protein